MAEDLDLRPNLSVPAHDYEKEGHDLAHESRLDADALHLTARQIAAEAAAERDAEKARLTKQTLSLPVEIERKKADLSCSVTRLKNDELHPEESRQARARECDERAQQEQAKLRHDRPLLVFSVIGGILAYCYYGSAVGTAMNFGAKLDAATTASELVALATRVLDPRSIFEALRVGNPLPALFPGLPLAIAYIVDRLAAARARRPLAICILTIFAIDLMLGYGVTKNLHDISVIAGLEPDTPWTIADAFWSWKFWLVLLIGFGTTAVFALLNHLRHEERRKDLARIAAIRDEANAHRKAVELDRENRVKIPGTLRELSAQLEAAGSQLRACVGLTRNALEAKLVSLSRGWLRYAASVHASDEARLAKIKQDAEKAISAALKQLESDSLDDILTRMALSIDPKGVQV